MNERIKELALQAASFAETEYNKQTMATFHTNKSAEEIFREKFAELIVQECVSIVAKRKNQAIDDGWNVDEAMSMAEMDLEEHFGVEE